MRRRARACDEAQLARVGEWAQAYRERLADLSWYMRVLNEGIARLANKEDQVKGRFWEGRFKSQALLDEQALFAAMAYVDLNPIRAGIAETPEASRSTSIEARLLPDAVDRRIQATIAAPQPPAQAPDGTDGTDGKLADEPAAQTPGGPCCPAAPLVPFDATGQEDWAIPCALEDYVELVETLGRCLHPRKRGFIPEKTPKLLIRLGIDTEAFIAHSTRFLKEFGHAVGTPQSLIALAAHRQAKFLRGMRAARKTMDLAA